MAESRQDRNFAQNSKNMKLKKYLIEFEKAYLNGKINESTISSYFREIAKRILNGGYIDVYGEFRIYARTLEFYFHEEEGDIKDPIVYHRNGKYGDLLPFPPYFPMMSLHAHMSGFDITFESEKGKYRASALIRKYSVYKTDGTLIVDNAIQSTYLYNYLNGFSLDTDKRIVWKDTDYDSTKALSPASKRRNAYYGKKWQAEKHIYDYDWSFSAIDPIIFE